MTKDLAKYDDGTLKRGDKGDYIWRTEQTLGVATPEDLLTAPFAKRFPTFASMLAVNSTEAGWASPSRSNFRHNFFLNNSVGSVCMAVRLDTSVESDLGLSTICDDQITKQGFDR